MNTEERIKRKVYQFLINEGYHGNYPAAEGAAGKLAKQIVEEIDDVIEYAWMYQDLM